MDKQDLRDRITARIAELEPDERIEETRRVRDRLEQVPAFEMADTLLVYVSLPDEVGTRDLIEDLLAEGREVCVPRCVGEGLDAVPIESLDDLETSGMGVPEPPGGRPHDPRLLDLAIVPGRAFDHRARRLGRGGGRFDRLLADLDPLSIGLSFECQIVHEVPTDPHDQPVDLVIHPWGTERRPPG